MTKRLFLLLTLLFALLLSMGAWANGTVHEVTIKDFAFHPPELTVKVGDRVRWVNGEKRQYHSVWFQERGDPEPDYFFPGESVEYVFDKPGAYRYRCGPHKEMRGVILVQ